MLLPPPAATPPEGAVNRHGETEVLPGGATATHWFVQAADVVWHVVTTGRHDHTPLLFLHGFPETWYAWHHQLSGLADRYACIAIDCKGYGQSDHRLDTPWGYDAQAAELPALLDVLGVDSLALVAHDRGAVIADHLCAVPGMADRIHAYVRMQQSGNRPHGGPRPPHELSRSPEAVEVLRTGMAVDLAYGLLPRPGAAPLVARPIDGATVARIKAETRLPGVAESMSASSTSASFDRELEERLDRLFPAMTMPVLFLQGSLDPGQQPHEYETVTSAVADGYLQFVDAGHFLHLEAPTEVTAAIDEFLRDR